jgi:hypothetical protein
VTWCWLAVRDRAPAGAERTVALSTPEGAPAGVLAVWPRDEPRPPGALRVDHRVVAGGAALTWLSLVLAPTGVAGVAFDDGAVTGALRRRLAQPWPGSVSTLLVDWATFGGAISAGATAADVADDPFARVFPRRLLRVPDGALGAVPAPTGPPVTRYGSGNPWPWDRYAGQVS